MNIFTPLMGYIFWYLLLAYRPFWKTQTTNVLLLGSVIPLWYLLERFHVQSAVARAVEKPLYGLLRLSSRGAAVFSDKVIEKKIKNLPISEEERQHRRKAIEEAAEEFR